MTHMTPEKGFISPDWPGTFDDWPDGDPDAVSLAETPRDAFPHLTSLWLSEWDDPNEPPF